MAAPNIVNVTTIYGSTNVAAAITSFSNVVVNPASSGTVVKVNTVTLANYSTAATSANVDIFRNGTSYLMAGNISVPAQSILIVSAKDTSFYLVEGDALRVNAAANGYITVTSSFETIS